MDKIFIKERVDVVDYKNRNLNLLFSSQSDIEGGAYDVQIEEDVAGWKQMTFSMPAFLVREGKMIKNPLLLNAYALSKLKHTLTYEINGEVREEEYFYVVQPQDGVRDEKGIVTYSYTAVDYPRHSLSKKKQGLTIGEDTLDKDLTLTPDGIPTDIPGYAIYRKAPVQQNEFLWREGMEDEIIEAESTSTGFVPFELTTWAGALPGAFAHLTKPDGTLLAWRLTGPDYSDSRYWTPLEDGEGYSVEDGELIPDAVWSPSWMGYPEEPNLDEPWVQFGVTKDKVGTINYYWDIWFDEGKSMGRYDGVLYQEGEKLLFNAIRKTLDYDLPTSPTDGKWFVGTFYNLEKLKEDYGEDKLLAGVSTAYAWLISTMTIWDWTPERKTWEDTKQTKRELFKTKEVYKGDWHKLEKIEPKLCPNYAKAYLQYILKDTDWKVGNVDTIMVEDGQIENETGNIPTEPKEVELSTYVDIDNSNCYNAIAEVAEVFKAYPRYRVEKARDEDGNVLRDEDKNIIYNKFVDLSSIPGKDYGLTYRWREDLKNSKITSDGEKAVSKLWVYGGEDLTSEVSIIDVDRREVTKYKGSTLTLEQLEEKYKDVTLEEGDYAKLQLFYTWDELTSQTKGSAGTKAITGEFKAGEVKVATWGQGVIPEVDLIENLPEIGSLGQTIFVTVANTYYSWVNGAWCDTNLEAVPGLSWQATQDDYDTSTAPIITSVDELPNPSATEKGTTYRVHTTAPDGTEANAVYKLDEWVELNQLLSYENGQWINKGDYYEYWEVLSPACDNAIYNFDYFLNKKLITEEEVEDIKYNYLLWLSKWNKRKAPLLEKMVKATTELLTRNAQYDAAQIARDAVERSFRSCYAIYNIEVNDSNLAQLVETTVYALPPGATGNKEVVGGWTPSSLRYSTENIVLYGGKAFANFDELKKYTETGSTAPVFGQYAKVEDTQTIYCYTEILNYKNTITSYLEKDLKDVKEENASNPEKELYNNNHTLEARTRNIGLFESFRDELVNRKGLDAWHNPPGSIEEVPPEETGDAKVKDTSLAKSYYNAVEQMLEYDLEMQDCLNRISELEHDIFVLEQQIAAIVEVTSDIERRLRENYGDYIIEGQYTEETTVYPYQLWKEGLKALELYRYPLVTYELGVLDLSGLPEFRTKTKEVYHDIVYRMTQPQLILPQAGDFVYVTDETLDIVKVQANITSTTRNLSQPSQNQVTINIVDTNTEELIGQLITATNTMVNKQNIYNRAAVINADGVISSDSINGATEDKESGINLVSRNGAISFTDAGILAESPNNALQKMQLTGQGLFASTDGGVTWNQIISDSQINISALSAGSIDSKSVTIANKNSNASIMINSSGIIALNQNEAKADPNKFNFGTYGDKVSFFLDASSGDAYFKGMITAGSGSIAGWTIKPGELYSTNVGLRSSEGNANEYAMWAGSATPNNDSPFWIKHNGEIKATNATIVGNITATTGKIGNWYVDNGAIKYNNNVYLGSDGAVKFGSSFSVSNTGRITATAGDIGGWHIDSNRLYNDNNTEFVSTPGWSNRVINVNGGTFYVLNSGYMNASSGKIGGWSLTGGNLVYGNNQMIINGNNGTISTGKSVFGNGGLKWTDNKDPEHFFVCGVEDGPENPAVSGFNIGNSGLAFFSDLTSSGSTGTQYGSIGPTKGSGIDIYSYTGLLRLYGKDGLSIAKGDSSNINGAISVNGDITIMPGITKSLKVGGDNGVQNTVGYRTIEVDTDSGRSKYKLTFYHGLCVKCDKI